MYRSISPFSAEGTRPDPRRGKMYPADAFYDIEVRITLNISSKKFSERRGLLYSRNVVGMPNIVSKKDVFEYLGNGIYSPVGNSIFC